jgi:predicted phosphate transport protein (TIGR00153 family)
VFKKLFSGGNPEQAVIDKISEHIRILSTAADALREGIEKNDRELIASVSDLEREGDSIRRAIVSHIFEGAFLPFLRPFICRFVEMADQVFDELEDAAVLYGHAEPYVKGEIRENVLKVAALNTHMCEMLLIAFETLFSSGDLREKSLAIRVYEKRVDEIKFDLLEQVRTVEPASFWDGRTLARFIDYMTQISDVIEDASDYLQIINVSLR